MYTYKAIVTRIVDADTVDMEVDVGFSISVRHRFRINNFDAPETWRPKSEAERQHGVKAIELATQLLQGKQLIINSYKLDIYARYAVDIILPDGRDFATVMMDAGMEKLITYL